MNEIITFGDLNLVITTNNINNFGLGIYNSQTTITDGETGYELETVNSFVINLLLISFIFYFEEEE